MRLLIKKPIDNIQNTQIDPNVFRRNPDEVQTVPLNIVQEHRSIVIPSSNSPKGVTIGGSSQQQVIMNQQQIAPMQPMSTPVVKKIKSKFIQVKKSHHQNPGMSLGSMNFNNSNNSNNKRVTFF